MKFLSVCSGIEAASVAWEPLGWEAVGFSEIEPFPSAVLAHHYPGVPNHGDMTQLPDLIRMGLVELPDLLCGGTPCQAFSVAGLRRSLEDERGNLSLVFCEIANAIDDERAAAGLEPGIVFWENVPGVLSTKDNAFGCFLAGLAGEDEPLVAPGGKWTDAGFVLGPQRAVAWRTLDAQYFGLAQRRRRVFVVASARDDFDPAAVLFEFSGVRRDSPPSREAREVAPTIPSRSTAGGGLGTDFDLDGGVIQPTPKWWDGGDVAATITTKSDNQRMTDKGNAQLVISDTVTAKWSKGADIQQGAVGSGNIVCAEVSHALRGEGFDASEDGTGRGTPIVPSGSHWDAPENPHPTLNQSAKGSGGIAASDQELFSQRGAGLVPVAFAQNTRDEVRLVGGDGQVVGALTAEPGMKQTSYVAVPTAPEPPPAYTFRADAMREGTARTPSPDAEGRVRLRDPGMGVYEEVAPTLDCGAAHGVAQPIALHPTQDPISSTDGTTHCMGTGSSRGDSTVAIAFSAKDYGGDASEEVSPTLRAMSNDGSHANGGGQVAVSAFKYTMGAKAHGIGYGEEQSPTLDTRPESNAVFSSAMQVRRLTPVECERLQGFPDNYTAIPWRGKAADQCPDGPRYKALGNSWAVPVVRWIGRRIDLELMGLLG